MVRIGTLGFGTVPQKKKVKVPRSEQKRLYEEVSRIKDPCNSYDEVVGTARVFSFQQGANSMEKGERCDDVYCDLSVGTTLRFNVMAWMYEPVVARPGDGKGGGSVFPDEEIPPFTLVQVSIKAVHVGATQEQYGLKLVRVRPAEFTAYSLLCPLGLSLLPSSLAEAVQRANEAAPAMQIVEKMHERTNVGFFCTVQQGCTSRVSPMPDFIRLYNVAEGLNEVDLPVEAVVRYTNCALDDPQARVAMLKIILDLACTAGALRLYVFHNSWYTRGVSRVSCLFLSVACADLGADLLQDSGHLEHRAVPLIDTEKLLDFIQVDPRELSSDAREASFAVPYPIPGLVNPRVTLLLEPFGQGGVAPPSQDLVLGAGALAFAKGYELVFSDDQDDDLWRMVFMPKQRLSVPGGPQGPDFRALKRLREEGEELAGLVLTRS